MAYSCQLEISFFYTFCSCFQNVFWFFPLPSYCICQYHRNFFYFDVSLFVYRVLVLSFWNDSTLYFNVFCCLTSLRSLPIFLTHRRLRGTCIHLTHNWASMSTTSQNDRHIKSIRFKRRSTNYYQLILATNGVYKSGWRKQTSSNKTSMYIITISLQPIIIRKNIRSGSRWIRCRKSR